jgi:hypothetical protein
MSLATEVVAWRHGILTEVAGMIAAAIGSIRAPVRVVDVPVVLGARGTALVVGAQVFFRLGLNGQANVLTWSLAGTVAGVAAARSVTVDVQTGTTLAAVASICGTNKPALVTQNERADQPPTSWTATAINDPMWVLVTATAVDGVIEVVSLTLRLGISPR